MKRVVRRSASRANLRSEFSTPSVLTGTRSKSVAQQRDKLPKRKKKTEIQRRRPTLGEEA